MKSIIIKSYGGSDVVSIDNDTKLHKDRGEGTLVDIKAAGVNPIDWKIREGYMKQNIRLDFPITLGMDFSGIVNETNKSGKNSVSTFESGDEVFGQASVTHGGTGAFAEKAITNNDNIALKPKSLSYKEAAGLPLVGVSAWQALVENMNLSADQKILIHGGAGGIGSIAIQLAKDLNAYVATTANSDDSDFVKAMGADQIIDYKTQTFEDIVKDFDSVYDTVGGETYQRSFRVLKNGGIIVSMLEQPNSNLMEKYGVVAKFQFTQVNYERLTKLADWVDKKDIKINIDKTFPLEDAAAALEYVKNIHPRGKVVLSMVN
jgi:NADPH:quinone reductase-like Zn-dependent oxidoreductase